MAHGNVMKKGITENSDFEFDVELLGCAKDDMGSLDQTQLRSLAGFADEENGAMTNIEVHPQNQLDYLNKYNIIKRS